MGLSAEIRFARFRNFTVDLVSGELRKNGIRVKLATQSFQVLTILLRRAGEVVSREEIRLALWPDETVVEFDHSINIAINRIRTALGDPPGRSSSIETLRGRGYCF